MNMDEKKERFVDVGPDLGWACSGRDPSGGGYTGVDDRGEFFGNWASIGLEEAGVDLREDVVDRFGLFS